MPPAQPCYRSTSSSSFKGMSYITNIWEKRDQYFLNWESEHFNYQDWEDRSHLSATLQSLHQPDQCHLHSPWADQTCWFVIQCRNKFEYHSRRFHFGSLDPHSVEVFIIVRLLLFMLFRLSFSYYFLLHRSLFFK